LYFLLVFVKFVHLCLEQEKVQKGRGIHFTINSSGIFLLLLISNVREKVGSQPPLDTD